MIEFCVAIEYYGNNRGKKASKLACEMLLMSNAYE